MFSDRVRLNMTESLVKTQNNVVIVPAKKVQEKVEEFVPPDGGMRAYLVVISAFMCNGILFGIINTYSVIYISLQKSLEQSGDAAASSKACKHKIERNFFFLSHLIYVNWSKFYLISPGQLNIC